MATWAEAADAATDRLRAVGVQGAAREARWLIEEVTGAKRTVANREGVANAADLTRFESLVARRAAGEPLQYVIGHWPFRSLDLLVDQRALIPRPETEQVAGVAIAELQRLERQAPTVVDLGTGTGALALSIATECPTAAVIGVEASTDALQLATENRDRVGFGSDRVKLVSGSWFGALPQALRGDVDLIVTNPPYVADGDEVDDSVTSWEPHEALFAGPDGLDDLSVIVAGAPDWLAAHGVLVAEIGAAQGEAVTTLATDAGFVRVEVHKDLTGRDRILVAGRR